MESIDLWLDTAEVRRLAELLMKPTHHPAVTIAEAGFEADFLGFTTTAPAEVVESKSVTPVPVEGEVIQAAAEPLPGSARSPFLDVIHHFCHWMRENFPVKEMFILDRKGEVVFDESSHGRLHFPARSLALAPRRSGSNVGYVHIKISAGATLEVVPVETPNTYLVLGAVVPEALSPAAITAVKEAMILVAGAQTATRTSEQSA